jgi:hypothetical protein
MRLVLAWALLTAGAGFVAAADLSAPTQPAPAKKACRWVSDCQVCARGPDGRLVCSNIGIACQPKRQRCIRD